MRHVNFGKASFITTLLLLCVTYIEYDNPVICSNKPLHSHCSMISLFLSLKTILMRTS